jgi:hypothetical protein
MRWAGLLLVILAAGCGGSKESHKPAVPAVQTTCVDGINCGGTPNTYRHCTSVSRGFRACTAYPPNGRERSKVERRTTSGWVIVVRPRDVPISGWWRRVIASPDRKTLLGQWSGDCEIQTTYIIRVGAGRARPSRGRNRSLLAGVTMAVPAFWSRRPTPTLEAT